METHVNSTTEQSDQTLKTKALIKPPLAQLVCIDASLDSNLEGLKVELEETELTVGRAPSNTVIIDSMRVSRQHMRIYPENGQWLIEDLSSTNGIFINKTQTQNANLNHGDKISIASIPFRFELEYNATESNQDDTPILAPRPAPIQLNQNPEATIVMQSSPFFTGESANIARKTSPRFGW
jgi:pSer/pThr/pTyr-binding forkhead associated (FHA) protein